MTIRNRMLKTMAPLTGLVVLAAIAAAFAKPAGATVNPTVLPGSVTHILLAPTTLHAQNNCPAPFNVPGYTCVFQPAGVKSHSSSSSHTYVKVVIHRSLTANVREYEKIHNAVVGFNMMPDGLPTSQQHKCEWGDFAWSGWKTVDGKTVYTKSMNKHHGRTHACWDGHHWRQVGGDKNQWNCGNIVYKMHPPKHAIIVPRVVGFQSVAEFMSVFTKDVKKSATSDSSSSKTYFCTQPGWQVTYTTPTPMCYQAIQVPVVTPPTTTTPPACVAGQIKDSNGVCQTIVCTIGGVPYTYVPNGFINVSGICQQQSVTANCPSGTQKDSNGQCVAQANQLAAECDQQALNYPGSTHTFDSATNTCTIIQVGQNGVCSNQIVIIGGGSPVITQQGNCNSGSTTPPTPTLLVNNCTQPQEVPVGQIYGLITCDGYGPKGDTLKMAYGAQYGHWSSDPTKEYVSSGGDHVTSMGSYVAPADQPPVSSDGNHYDTITVTLTDVSNPDVKPVTTTISVKITAPDVHP